MCFGKDCPIKNDCIRYVAKPEKYQSYFEESPYFNFQKCVIKIKKYKSYDYRCDGILGTTFQNRKQRRLKW